MGGLPLRFWLKPFNRLDDRRSYFSKSLVALKADLLAAQPCHHQSSCSLAGLPLWHLLFLGQALRASPPA